MAHRTEHAYLRGAVCFSDIIVAVNKEMWRWTNVHLGTEMLILLRSEETERQPRGVPLDPV